MITRIEALNYRCLRWVSQRVSRFHTLVGPNASGKSTFLDVISFLGDLIRVGPLKAIRGEPGVAEPRASDPAHLCWMRGGGRFELAIEAAMPEKLASRLGSGKHTHARYEVGISAGVDGADIGLAAETFWLLPGDSRNSAAVERTLFPQTQLPPHSIVHGRTPTGWRQVVKKIAESGNDYFQAETSNWNNQFRLGPTKSALANLPEDEERFPIATWFKRLVSEGTQRVVLRAESIRLPSPPGSPRHYLPDGSNLPWVIEDFRNSDDDRFERWVAHLQTALPDLKSVETIERPEDRHRYLAIEYQTGLKAPSWVVSDGTLRVLALTLPAYLPHTEGIYLIEEPENGVHPRAIESVYQALSSVYSAQVLCASHSPVVLALAKPAELLCFAKDGEGASDIVSGNEHPRLKNWKGGVDLGPLFAAGVLG